MGLAERLGIRHHSPKAAPEPHHVWREGYVDLLARQNPAGEVKGAVLGVNDALGHLLTLADPTTVGSVSAQFSVYKQSSAVAIPIDLVAEQFAKITPILQNQETDDTESRHEILDLLRRPHPLFRRARFLETVAKYYLIAAESPLVALGRESAPPSMIQPLNPKNLSVVPDNSTGLPRAWKVGGKALTGTYTSRPRDMGAEFRSGNDRILKNIVGFSTEDDALLRGQSKLVAAARDIWTQIEGAKYNLSLLRQGGRTSLVFHFKQPMKMPEFLETKDAILGQVEGADNAGRVLVTKGGEVDIHEMGTTNRDMEHQAGQEMMRRVLFQRYKVPLVLESTDAATFNNYETALLALWDDAVIPLVGTIFGEIGDWLMPRFGLDPIVWRLWFDEQKIEVLRARKIRERTDRFKSGLETVNEIRKEIPGAEPAEGGDELLVPGTMQPLSAVAQEVDDLVLPGGSPPSGEPTPGSPPTPAPDPGEDEGDDD